MSQLSRLPKPQGSKVSQCHVFLSCSTLKPHIITIPLLDPRGLVRAHEGSQPGNEVDVTAVGINAGLTIMVNLQCELHKGLGQGGEKVKGLQLSLKCSKAHV